jgi:hypothetical protein
MFLDILQGMKDAEMVRGLGENPSASSGQALGDDRTEDKLAGILFWQEILLPARVLSFVEERISQFTREGLAYATEKMPAETQARLKALHKASRQ